MREPLPPPPPLSPCPICAPLPCETETREGYSADGDPGMAHEPEQEALHRAAFREMAEIERLANEHRDGWIEARHTDDGDWFRIATEEAIRWETIAALARRFVLTP